MKTSKSVLASIMMNAWTIAKRAANQFGGSSKQYFAMSLKKSWAETEVKVSLFDAYNSKTTLAKVGFIFNTANKAWEKIMTIADFKKRASVRYGRGFITSSQLESAYNHTVIFSIV